METEILQGELERLFSLDEMASLARDVLGMPADDMGGGPAASFARSLVARCREAEGLDALADVIIARRADVVPAVREATVHGFGYADELAPGSRFGEFAIGRRVGEGPLALTYRATFEGRDVILRVLRGEVAVDRRRVQRYLAHTRVIGALEHPGLPRGLRAGFVEGRPYVSYEAVDGQSVAARVSRNGPMHLNEARPILEGVLEALAALHDKRLAHGNVKAENVLVWREPGGGPRALLVDGGADRLRRRARSAGDVLGMVVTPKMGAPELHRGKCADARSDVYAVGVLAYELLAGRPPFQASTPVEIAALHLSADPQPPSGAAPRGWVSKETDAFVLSLLKKEPADRPRDARAVLDALEALGRASARPPATMSEEKVAARVDALVSAPDNEDAALALESAVEQGADAARVAEAFERAAEGVAEGDEGAARETKKSLLFRAARLFETAVRDGARAEGAYARICEIDPSDDVANAALERVRRKLGKHEELVEMLLARSERATSGAERARALADIGRLYAHELDDRGQALVAYTQALCEDPSHAEYAAEVERLAGADAAHWAEALQTLAGAAGEPSLAPDARAALLLTLGRWYATKQSRPDLALPCFQAVVAAEPSNDAALEGMATIYRGAQQWPELGAVLVRRADVAPSAARARDLRVQAAELLDQKLGDPARARELFAQVLAEDPGHAAAAAALASLYEREGDHAALAELLEARAEALRGPEKAAALVRLAEHYEHALDDLSEAAKRFEAAVAVDERNLDALKGLDRVFMRTGRVREVLANVDRQLAVAATPRQKIALLERKAKLLDEEFLDHAQAAATREAIAAIDPASDANLTELARHYRALERWSDVDAVYERQLKAATEPARRLEVSLARGRMLAEQLHSPERAMAAYEAALEASPGHPGALEALARLREQTGDATAALHAIEALAAKAGTPEAKAEQWLRAARLLDARGDRDGAIERYKAALEADGRSFAAMSALRGAYVARGDVGAAVDLYTREIEAAESKLVKARLYAEMAKALRDNAKDSARAEQAARAALDFDPTAQDALLLLADASFEAGRYVEAARYYEPLASRAAALPKADAARVLVRTIDSFEKAGEVEKALFGVEPLVATGDPAAVARAARLAFDHAPTERAYEINRDFVASRGEHLLGQERAAALYRLGELARRLGKLDEAAENLRAASDLDPQSPEPLDALAKLYADKGDWEEVVRTKTRRLDGATGDERADLLVDIGDLLASKLGDRTRAAKSFVTALDERPDDRRVLTKLMQLYSEGKDWAKLVEIVLRLADFVGDDKQKAKYYHTAASITARQLQDLETAATYFERVLDLDPSLPKALNEAIEVARQRGDWPAAERLLHKQLDQAQDAADRDRLIATFDALGELYERRLGRADDAVDALEAAQTLDPDNRERNERLAEIYVSNPAQYLDKAVAAQRMMLRHNPSRPEPYKLLRKLYTEAKRADSAFCLCQALYVLNLAEPDEERFFKRMRSETAAAAQERFSEEDWHGRIYHADADPAVTTLFALIEPAVIAARGRPLESLGYDERYAIDLSLHPYPMSQTLYYAAGILNMAPPPAFQNPNTPGGLSFLHARAPAMVLGRSALSAELAPQAAAFVAARHLAYFRPGLYLRHLVPTSTSLKAWLFAAIKLISPQFPLSPEIEGPVAENMRALAPAFEGPEREHLASVVAKLLQGGPVDLKKWIAAVDLSADRAGFVIAHDLEIATDVIRESGDAEASLPSKERMRELVLYSVSEEYFELRSRLGISVDG